MKHTKVKQISPNEWAVVGKNDDRVLASFSTEHDAQRAIADDKTPAERAAAFGDEAFAANKAAYCHEDEVLRRFAAGLPLPVADMKLARKLLRKKTINTQLMEG